MGVRECPGGWCGRPTSEQPPGSGELARPACAAHSWEHRTDSCHSLHIVAVMVTTAYGPLGSATQLLGSLHS